MVYLVKDKGAVRGFYSEAEMKAAGFKKADLTVMDEAYNANGCYAWIIDGEIQVGLTDAQKEAREKNEQIAEIKAKLDDIDRLDGPRPIREAVSQLAEKAGLDTSHMMQHETEAQALRQELAALNAV